MIRGRAAERAVNLAAAHYRRVGRADVRKQATGMRRVGESWAFAQKASIDYRWALNTGVSYCAEVKQHDGVSFPINESTLPGLQRNALDIAQKMSGEVWLIVDLPDLNETYAVLWQEVQVFLKAPYRHSLSLQWLQGIGYLVKTSGRNTSKFAIWFLDYAKHPLCEVAYLAEAIERAKGKIVEIDKTIERAPTPAVKRTVEECKASIREKIAAFKPKKKGAWR